jgi:hypothetical protein
MQRGGANVQQFGKDVAAFVAAHKSSRLWAGLTEMRAGRWCSF